MNIFPIGRPVNGMRPQSDPAPDRDVRPAPVGPVLPEEAVWQIVVRQQDTCDATWRGRLLEQMRVAIEKRLREDPGADAVRLTTALGTVEARVSGGPSRAGASVRLAFAAGDRDLSPPSARNAPGPAGAAPALPALSLPDEGTHLLGERLVGLDTARQALLLKWGCLWDGGLEAWSGRAGQAVPSALRDHLRQSHALHVFHGDPGTGKTALARVVANDYCVRRGVPGTVLSLTTEARGEGLVGQFSQRLRAGFDQLLSLPEAGLRVLLIDEADALAMRRSEAQSHQEDRAATATILQALDALVGQRRLAVILTTNLPTGIDAAVRRRAHLVAFARPGAEARRLQLSPWLPGATPRDLDRAAAASQAMTPADIERTLLQAWLSAVGRDATLTASEAVAALREADRTGAV